MQLYLQLARLWKNQRKWIKKKKSCGLNTNIVMKRQASTSGISQQNAADSTKLSTHSKKNASVHQWSVRSLQRVIKVFLFNLIGSLPCLLDQSILLIVFLEQLHLHTENIWDVTSVWRPRGWWVWWPRSSADYHPSALTRTMGESREQCVSPAYWRQLQPSNHS